MKKTALILFGMLIMVFTIEAKTGNEKPNRIRVNYTYDNAVNFIERGIEFYIFTNGDFDFNTHLENSYNDYNRRINNRGVRVNRDYRGRITRIGNAFINYDYRGNVTRIGSISMRYRFGKLTKVGDLRVHYNRWGNPNFYGNVRDFYYDNGIRFNISFGDICNYNDSYFYRNDFKRNYNQFREDQNFYYYKARPNAKIGKRSTILKRRKPTAEIDPRKKRKRNANNSYRKPNRNKKVEVVKNTKKRTSSIIKRENSTQRADKNSSSIKTDKNSKKRKISRKKRS